METDRNPVEIAPCNICKLKHPKQELRWTCSGCQEVVCAMRVARGKDFNREGLVHVMFRIEEGKPPAAFSCGQALPLDTELLAVASLTQDSILGDRDNTSGSQPVEEAIGNSTDLDNSVEEPGLSSSSGDDLPNESSH